MFENKAPQKINGHPPLHLLVEHSEIREKTISVYIAVKASLNPPIKSYQVPKKIEEIPIN